MFKVAEFGNDFDASFTFENGDLVIVEDKKNIVQSILNRLNTEDGVYDLFYNEYGGVLNNYLGWKADEKTLKFMEIEIVNILNQDPRFTKFNINVDYTGNGNVKIDLDLFYDEDTDLSLSFVINDEQIVEEYEEA